MHTSLTMHSEPGTSHNTCKGDQGHDLRILDLGYHKEVRGPRLDFGIPRESKQFQDDPIQPHP